MDGSGHTQPGTILGAPSIGWAPGPSAQHTLASRLHCGPSLPEHAVPRFLAVTECQCFLQEAWLSGWLLPQELPLAGPGTSRQIGASPRVFVLTSVRQKPGDGFPVLQAAETSERGAGEPRGGQKLCRACGLQRSPMGPYAGSVLVPELCPSAHGFS